MLSGRGYLSGPQSFLPQSDHGGMTLPAQKQCDQIGRILEFLATNFVTKVALMFGDFLGSYEKHCFISQTG